MTVNHEVAKKFINQVGMGLTCIIVIYGLVQISDNYLTKAFMFVFGIFVEVETQYIWGLSFAYKDKGCWAKAGWLKAACIGYILIGILLAVGFFSMEISTKEKAAQTITQAQNNQQAKVDQYNAQIRYYQAQANNETDKRGPRAIEIEGLINEAISKRDELENTPVVIESEVTETQGTVFTALGDILKPFGFTENILKLVIFGYCVFMIYLGVMLTYWKVNIEDDETPVADNTVTSAVTKKHRKFKPVTAIQETAVTDEHVTLEPVTYGNELCICGCNRPRRVGSKYYSNACKTKRSRDKKKQKELAMMKNEEVRVL